MYIKKESVRNLQHIKRRKKIDVFRIMLFSTITMYQNLPLSTCRIVSKKRRGIIFILREKNVNVIHKNSRKLLIQYENSNLFRYYQKVLVRNLHICL